MIALSKKDCQQDKNYAHKDKDYEAAAYHSLNAMAAANDGFSGKCTFHGPRPSNPDFIHLIYRVRVAII